MRWTPEARPRYAWAVEVTANGRIAWQTPLATHGTDSISPVPAVLAGPVAVLAQDGIVHGLRIADGRPLWAWRGGQSVYGMWRWGGLVAVLTDQVSNHARITGLDAATGTVRWVRRLPGPGLLGNQVATDGRLAMLRPDVAGFLAVRLVSRDAATGKQLWARTLATTPGGPQPVLRMGGQAIVQTVATHPHQPALLLSYDLATGRLDRQAAMPAFVQTPPVPVAGGLLVQPADTGYACASAG